MESYTQLSEEQLEGIHHLLLKSPPCELHIVLKEIKDLLAGAEIPQAFLENALKEYNLTHNVLVSVPDEERPIVLFGLMDDENVYSSTLSGKSYAYDHIMHQVLQEVAANEPYCDANLQSLRQEVIASGKKYVEKRFLKSSGFFVGVDGNHMDIVITGELNKLVSFYAGRWVSRYTLDLSSMQLHVGNDVMAGAIDVSTHYFENGNVRMDLHKDMPIARLSLSTNQLGEELFKLIGEFEDQVQQGLGDAFASLQQDTLKNFRRQLPRTHQHFVWRVNAHKMADTMKQVQRA